MRGSDIFWLRVNTNLRKMHQSGLDLVKVHVGGGYDSDFSDEEGGGQESQNGQKRKHEDEVMQKQFKKGPSTVAHRNVAAEELDREEARNRRHHFMSMNAFDRHKKFVSDYILYYGGKLKDFKRSTAKDKIDLDVVRENHRFLWRDEDEEDMTWEKELAKKYYDKLFKEYCIADISRYKENKFGFRWRIENEVISGKGQFLCGNKNCDKQEGLKSWEVNFAYVEHGEKRNALVKLRLCPECSFKLNYHHKRKEAMVKKKKHRPKRNRDKQQEKKTSPNPKKHKNKQKECSTSDSMESESEEGGKTPSGSKHWKGPAPNLVEKSREEEFDEYFEDMFL
ncbi:protein FRA10AC1 [Salminus brasiliensis]|uniref:protein FRA10AC1 n=1 Tax=Salminus brasiliensis TaxID=930266 RepID=UPI003B82FBC5